MPRGCRNTLIILVVLGATIFVALGLGAAIYYGAKGGTARGGLVALIEVKGPIFEVDRLLLEIQDRRRDDRVKAVVVRIDSPGGGVGASQELFRELQKTREAGKLVVASMGGVAASGGYYVACAADHIIANPGTITGSIGVIAQFPNMEGLMEKIGVTFQTLKTGAYKDTGSAWRDMTEDERQVMEELLFDVYAQFTEHIAESRNLDLQTVQRLADGRVYSGRQAIAHGLVDEEGTILDAIAYAGRMSGIGEEPQVLRRERRRWGPFELTESLSRLLPSTGARPLRPGIYYLWP